MSPTNKAQAQALGERVTTYRSDVGLSIADLAARTGLSRSFLFAIEAGEAPRPSGESLYLLAEALGVTMSDLLGRKLLSNGSQKSTPPALVEFAAEHNLPEADVAMLQAIEFRGGQPQTKKRWEHIYSAIRGTEWMDREGS